MTSNNAFTFVETRPLLTQSADLRSAKRHLQDVLFFVAFWLNLLAFFIVSCVLIADLDGEFPIVFGSLSVSVWKLFESIRS
jgi:hypothetical protein